MKHSNDILAAISTINNVLREYVQNDQSDSMAALHLKDNPGLPVNDENVAEEERVEYLWKSVTDIGIKEAKETTGIENHSNCLNEVVNDKRSSNFTKRDFGLTWD